MSITHVAYLGPEGTFSHMVARKRFGSKHILLPLPSIFDVFDYVRSKSSRYGIVPIENSSGGTIYETVDCLLSDRGPLSIKEELSMDVRLALMGRKGAPVKAVYSHFAPMQHCDSWLRTHLPDAERREIASTAKAAEAAAAEPGAAALGTSEAARRYKLDVLVYPVESDVPNVTQFFCIGRPSKPLPNSSKTSIVVTLANRPGSLCDFLQTFKDGGVNLSRILSRPIIGQPRAYLFFVDLAGTPSEAKVRRVLDNARRESASLRLLGVYPVRSPYRS
jgi:chorismate mutase / prephenate dehydratase